MELAVGRVQLPSIIMHSDPPLPTHSHLTAANTTGAYPTTSSNQADHSTARSQSSSSNPHLHHQAQHLHQPQQRYSQGTHPSSSSSNGAYPHMQQPYLPTTNGSHQQLPPPPPLRLPYPYAREPSFDRGRSGNHPDSSSNISSTTQDIAIPNNNLHPHQLSSSSRHNEHSPLPPSINDLRQSHASPSSSSSGLPALPLSLSGLVASHPSSKRPREEDTDELFVPYQNSERGGNQGQRASSEIGGGGSGRQHSPANLSTNGNSPPDASSSAAAQAAAEAESGDDKGGAAGRALKNTKRAAQNRAAQQAFRKRKEERIRELEEKEKQLNALLEGQRDLLFREQLIREREKRLAHYSDAPQRPSGAVAAGSPEDGRSRATAQTGTEFSDQHANAVIALAAARERIAQQESDLESSRKRLDESLSLVDSLRRSLEDFAGENRELRFAIEDHAAQLHNAKMQQSPIPQEA